jgi:hypothetical protein
MGFMARMATKAMVKTVRTSLPGASDEKLKKHHQSVSEALHMNEDEDCNLMLIELRIDIANEMERRGLI